MNFDNHIKKLTSELDLSSLQNEEKNKEIIEDAQEMKDLINQQKKKNKKKKKHFEFTEEMANEQLNLFAKANMMMTSSSNNIIEEVEEYAALEDEGQREIVNEVNQINQTNFNSSSLRKNGNKKMKLDHNFDEIFEATSINKNEEVDFD